MIKIQLSDRFKKRYSIIYKNNNYYVKGINTSLADVSRFISEDDKFSLDNFKSQIVSLYQQEKLNFEADFFIRELQKRYNFRVLNTTEKQLALEDTICANLNYRLNLVRVDGRVMPKNASINYKARIKRDEIEEKLIAKFETLMLDDLFVIYDVESLATFQTFLRITQLTRDRMYRVLYVSFHKEFYKNRKPVSKVKAEREISRYIVARANEKMRARKQLRSPKAIQKDIELHKKIIKKLEMELKHATTD